jgi:hypothetical protein
MTPYSPLTLFPQKHLQGALRELRHGVHARRGRGWNGTETHRAQVRGAQGGGFFVFVFIKQRGLYA